jgi:hypothetical protein
MTIQPAENRHVGFTIAQESFFLLFRQFLVILEAFSKCLLHSPVFDRSSTT